jgi:hypothetical protein
MPVTRNNASPADAETLTQTESSVYIGRMLAMAYSYFRNIFFDFAELAKLLRKS